MEFSSQRDDSWLEVPQINAEDIKMELSELRPQMDEAMRMAQDQMQHLNTEEMQKAMKQAQAQMERMNSKEFRDAMKKAQEQIAAHSDEMQKAMEKAREQMEKSFHEYE